MTLPVEVNSLLLGSAGSGGALITDRSLRFRGNGSSANFNKAFAANSSSKKTFTYSVWIKRGAIGQTQATFLLGSDGTSSAGTSLLFASDALQFQLGGAVANSTTTTRLFRDPSAWYHIVLAVDTTSATTTISGTSTDRVRMYVNGDQITSFSATSVPTLNADTQIFTNNSNVNANRIGYLTSLAFDGLQALIHYIDGQALTPSSFARTDPVTNMWVPKPFSGSYGTNGFHLNFRDNSSLAALGTDSSGQGNNWSSSTGISLTAGATYDSMTDVPVLGADATNNRGNYAVLNPLTAASGLTVSEGNLKIAASVTGSKFVNSSMALPPSGAYYAEIVFANTSSASIGQTIGICTGTRSSTAAYNATGAFLFYASATGNLIANGTGTGTGLATISANDLFQVAVDVTNSKMWIGRSNVWYNSTGGTTGDPSTGANPTFTGAFVDYFIYAGFDTAGGAVSATINFGQRPFSFTPPTNFKALNTYNLSTPTIIVPATAFDVALYTGNGSTQSIVNSSTLQPDLVMIKNRNGVGSVTANQVFDSGRGVRLKLATDATNGSNTEASNPTNYLTAFNSNGFTVVDDMAGTYGVNGGTGSPTYAAAQWKKGATQGVDVVTYTGNGTGARAIAHALGVTPKLIIIKCRNAGATQWAVYHVSLPAQYIILNSTAIAAADGGTIFGGSTPPNGSNFIVGTDARTNVLNNTYVAYLFTDVPQFSKFGSYFSNAAADGPFLNLGFRPRYIFLKRAVAAGGSTAGWIEFDTARNPYNVSTNYFFFESTGADGSLSGAMDLLSNGVKLRTNNTHINTTAGDTYIYAAFAEAPFKYALAR